MILSHADVVGSLRRSPGLLSAQKKLAAGDFARTQQIAKVTIPSPSLWVNFWSRQHSSHVYRTLESFLADVLNLFNRR